MLDRLETYWREMLLQSSELCIFQMHQGCQDCVGGRCHSYWLCLHYWNSNISSFWLQVFCLQMNNESSNLIINSYSRYFWLCLLFTCSRHTGVFWSKGQGRRIHKQWQKTQALFMFIFGWASRWKAKEHSDNFYQWFSSYPFASSTWSVVFIFVFNNLLIRYLCF